jgi:hypothetical protein
MGGETPHSHGADEPRPGGQDGARLAPDGGAHLATAVGPEAQRAGVAPKTFGGLRAAQALTSAPVAVTLIDRRNYHRFQPLLYQVATGSLSAGKRRRTDSTHVLAAIRVLNRLERVGETLRHALNSLAVVAPE